MEDSDIDLSDLPEVTPEMFARGIGSQASHQSSRLTGDRSLSRTRDGLIGKAI